MELKHVKRDYFLQLCKKFTASLDNVVTPVVLEAESRIRKSTDAGKRITVRTQTDINDFINSPSNPTASATAGFFDFLVVTCPQESRDYLQNLRNDTEDLIGKTSHLIGKYKEFLPVLNTMVPGTEEQIDLVKDAAYCLKYMDARMKSDKADWFKYEKKYFKQPDETDSSSGEDNADKKDDGLIEKDLIGTKDKSKCIEEPEQGNFSNTNRDFVSSSKKSGDADVNMAETLAKQANDNSPINNLETSSDANGDCESDTDNYVVKQCTHDGCDYSIDTDSKLSFHKHFKTHHPGVTRPDKWVIKDISTSEYMARKAKWNTLGDL